jgi:hypothetical protein
MPLSPSTSSYVALYGAALSTAIFLRDARNRSPRARVSVSYGHNPETKRLEDSIGLAARIANHGRETILLGSCGLEVRRGARFRRSLNGSQTPQGLEIKPGQSVDFVFPLDLARGIGGGPTGRALRVVFYDQLERPYYSGYFLTGEWIPGTHGPMLTDLKRLRWWQVSLQRYRRSTHAVAPVT